MKKCIFYCDIEGTYRDCFNSESAEQRHINLQKFANILDLLCEMENKDKIFFSFVSSDNINDVIKCIEEFLPYVNKSKHIEMGTSFGDVHKVFGNNTDNYIKHNSIGKAFQVLKNTEHITSDVSYPFHAEIDNIYFADDSLINHNILFHSLQKKYPHIKLVCFIPGNEACENNMFGVKQKNIDGVIKSIAKYISMEDIYNEQITF